jgi:hypothetical protein
MPTVDDFLKRWSGSSGSERANAQPFFIDLCDLLGVERPRVSGPDFEDYRFEKAVWVPNPDGGGTQRFIDLYKRDCFVIENKQANDPDDPTSGVRRDGDAWKAFMERAFVQARTYAINLPEGRPPFVITCDIGHCFEIWSGFGEGGYGQYPAGRRIPLADLTRPEVRDELRTIFTDPWSLDPSRRAARVTREVAAHLAGLARDLEAQKHDPETVARFLMRCLFTMFAEDVALLEDHIFTRTLADVWIAHPERFPAGIESLWHEMDRGGLWGAHPIRRFNGGLFREVHALPLTVEQLQRLLAASRCDWSDVEPAIFGTLLERALSTVERHKLGAHFTPREYIERLVRPTVIEPLRAEWDAVRAAARQVLESGEGEPTPSSRRQAVALVHGFHKRLCDMRVLDPACGTGNFLYVTFDLVKQLEAEVLRELSDLGEGQSALELAGVRVIPEQFLGIETNPRAQAIAELVLWLGALQWALRTGAPLTDPILHDAHNIECRDAVLAHDLPVMRRDPATGKPVTVWDMRTKRKHPVTGREIPDEDARVEVKDYPNARAAEWPDADFIVSNPPFLGGKDLREALGDGYAETLWRTYPEVGASADFVMYWWHKAARLVRQGKVRRFGFITTNSITQVFDRRVIESHLNATEQPLSVAWAIPDHPWVVDGAAVRIAMSVGCRTDAMVAKPMLGRVTREDLPDHPSEGAARMVDVVFSPVVRIHADLSGGADVTAVVPLKANDAVCSPGVKLHGAGFIVSPDQAQDLGLGTVPGLERHIRQYLNGRDLAQTSRGMMVIDLFGLDIEDVRERFPKVYQRILETVKPERDQNRRDTYRLNWWIFGEPRSDLRKFLDDQPRYIATVETSKHRWFTFLDAEVLPDNRIVNFGLSDSYALGILSSKIHVCWTLIVGGTLEDRPIYTKTTCFDPFPFPDATEAQKARIRDLGEQLDAHRKRVQAAHPDVTLTGMYNALTRLREANAGGPALDDKERAFHDRALIGVLATIHDDLDAAVADAYGWPVDLPDDEILARLVSLNAVRAAEEAQGFVRWLRPDFQRARAGLAPVQPTLDGMETKVPEAAAPAATGQGGVAAVLATRKAQPWPSDRYAQIKAVRDLLATLPGTATAAQVASAFTGARPAAVRRHLDMLEQIGVLTAWDAPDDRRWHAPSQ